MAWDVDPIGVRGVLVATEGVAAGFDPLVTDLNFALDGVMAHSASAVVIAAVTEFAEAQTRHLEFVFTRTGAAIGGAVMATNAYIAGDQEMAASAAAAAAGAPDPIAIMPGRGTR